MSLSEIFKAYDVRGLVPSQWDAAVAGAIGAAFADVVAGDGGGSALVMGRDMRESGTRLSHSFALGAAARGVDVIDIGMCSTDELYFASGTLDMPGAMFTASHNPAAFNGIKMCRAQARPIGEHSGLLDIRELAERYLATPPPKADRPGAIQQRDLLGQYASFLRSLVDISGVRPLKIVIDAGNGMAGLTAPAVFGTAADLPALPIEVVPLYFELDGSFPNHEANPLNPANLVDLSAAVLEHRADLGLAFDGDADRCFVVDEAGKPVSASAVTIMVALREIAREQQAGREPVIIHNLISSQAVPELASAAGARVIRSRVGHSFIKAEMARSGAVFGGEHSGHYYFRDFFCADTGMLAALHVIAALSDANLAMSDLSQMYQPYAASGEINTEVADAAAAIERVRRVFVDQRAEGEVTVDDLDGMTFSHWDATPRWWFNLRPSNTEPLLRLNVEAADEDIMVKIRDAVVGLLEEGDAQ